MYIYIGDDSLTQIQSVTGVDDNVPVKYSSEVLFYVDKYEIV